jgi:hypothetical protein
MKPLPLYFFLLLNLVFAGCGSSGQKHSDASTTPDNRTLHAEASTPDGPAPKLPETRRVGNLTWQVTPSAEVFVFSTAKAHCEALDFAGSNNWRLPTIDELRALIVGCPGREAGGSCEVSDPNCLGKECYAKDDCGHCEEKKGPDKGCYWQPGLWGGSCTDTWFYWSSSHFDQFTDHFWVVRYQGGGLFDDGVVGFNEELGDGSVRCVHD